MRNHEEICNIIDKISAKTLKVIDDAWYEMILDRGQTRKNARKRFLYNIKKIGLTEDEYDLWKTI